MLCKICRKDFISLNKYIIHIEFAHNLKHYYECPFPSCLRMYNKRCSFRKHINNIHLKMKKPSENVLSPNNNFLNRESTSKNGQELSSTQTLHTSNSPASFCQNSDPDPNIPFNDILSNKIRNFENILCQSITIFIGKIYSKPVNRAIIQDIIDSVTSFFSSGLVDSLKEIVTILTKLSNICADEENRILKMFDILQSPFDSISSEYKRVKFLQKCNFFVSPVQQVLGVTETAKRNQNHTSLVLRNSSLYSVPIKKTLIQFLQLPGVFEAILKYQDQIFNVNKSFLCNIMNGSIWKKRQTTNSTYEFPIVIYFDDFEVLNPLGSKAGCYKIGGVYFTVPNIPPCYASQLQYIFLALLFYSGDRSTFGNECIFRCLINELNELYNEGITINCGVKIKFVVVAITSDNLGLNSMLGFNESFNSNYYCRICTCNKDQCKTLTIENKELLRVKINYESDLENKLGIKEKCVFNDIVNFHVYENVYCDVMHDLFEGVHRYDMCVIINNLISKKYFTLNMLNSRIKYHTYNKFEKNIPPCFSSEQLKSDSLIMSASEMLILVLNFRFIIGDLVPQNDQTWKFYLIILEITEILISRVLRKNTVDYLQSLIEEHHILYMEESGLHLKPKFHNLLHYPTIILKIGPPIFLSCMRPESKHSEFKNIAHNVKCRKNIPYSLSFRYQLKQCSKFMSQQGFIDKIDIGPTPNKILSQTYRSFENVNVDEFYEASFYEINGIRYEENLILLSDYEDDLPLFCEIRNILVSKSKTSKVLLHCRLWQTIHFNDHLRCYEIEPVNKNSLFDREHFSFQKPMILNTKGSKYFTTLSY